MTSKLAEMLTHYFLDLHYTRLGKPTEQIGREVGCSGRQVRTYIKRLGIPFSPVLAQRRVERGKTGKIADNHFKAGQPSRLRGFTKDTHPGVAASAAWRNGRKRPDITGSKHFNWKNGATSEAMQVRNSKPYIEWRNAVFTRDQFTCKQCGGSGRLEAHHVKPFCSHPELRLDVSNGVTLCYWCHRNLPHPKRTVRFSDEHKAALSAAQKKRFARPGEREKQSLRRRAHVM